MESWEMEQVKSKVRIYYYFICFVCWFYIRSRVFMTIISECLGYEKNINYKYCFILCDKINIKNS